MLYSILLHSLNTLLTWIDIFSQVFIALFFLFAGLTPWWHWSMSFQIEENWQGISRNFRALCGCSPAARRRIRIWRHWPFCPRLVWRFWMFILFQIGDNWQVCPAALTFVTRICVICHMTLLFTRPKAFFLFEFCEKWWCWSLIIWFLFQTFKKYDSIVTFSIVGKIQAEYLYIFNFFFGKVHCVSCAWLFSILWNREGV